LVLVRKSDCMRYGETPAVCRQTAAQRSCAVCFNGKSGGGKSNGEIKEFAREPGRETFVYMCSGPQRSAIFCLDDERVPAPRPAMVSLARQGQTIRVRIWRLPGYPPATEQPLSFRQRDVLSNGKGEIMRRRTLPIAMPAACILAITAPAGLCRHHTTVTAVMDGFASGSANTVVYT
jgi:hypothetical protein